jgi:hypothetical protein
MVNTEPLGPKKFGCVSVEAITVASRAPMDGRRDQLSGRQSGLSGAVLRSFNVEAYGSDGIYGDAGSYILGHNMNFGLCGHAHISMAVRSFYEHLNGPFTVTGGASIHVAVGQQGMVYVRATSAPLSATRRSRISPMAASKVTATTSRSCLAPYVAPATATAPTPPHLNRPQWLGIRMALTTRNRFVKKSPARRRDLGYSEVERMNGMGWQARAQHFFAGSPVDRKTGRDAAWVFTRPLH